MSCDSIWQSRDLIGSSVQCTSLLPAVHQAYRIHGSDIRAGYPRDIDKYGTVVVFIKGICGMQQLHSRLVVDALVPALALFPSTRPQGSSTV